jgi:hypothetical protein
MKQLFGILVALLIGAGSGDAQAYQLYTNLGTMDVLYANTQGVKPTYKVQVNDITPVATATDLITLCGSATKVIRVTHVSATAVATGAAVIDLYIYKRTVPNTGGTSAAITAAKYDSGDAAPSSVALRYTANPSALGAGVLINGNIYEIPAITGNSYSSNPWSVDYGTHNAKAVVLRGVAQCLAFSLNGQTLPAGLSLYVGIEWTEE